MEQKAFQIAITDNVATALTDIAPGEVLILGDTAISVVQSTANIPRGHKIALANIAADEDILKYGIRIGKSIRAIAPGEWVHLHNIRSVYDERSSHLDIQTGAPTDIRYE